MSDIMESLEPFTWIDNPPNIPGWTGKAVSAGRMGSVVFIATEDFDGQIEISLAQYDQEKKPGTPSKRCTNAQAEWFFKQIGAEPISHEVSKGTRHFVVKRGVRQ